MLAIKRKRKPTQENKKPKTPKQMERHMKGVANHRRIEMLFLISEQEGITVDGISRSLECNMKTISVHLQRLEHAGLIRKRNKGRSVMHEISPYGKTICSFLKTFQHS